MERTASLTARGLTPPPLVEIARSHPGRGPFCSAYFETVSELPNAEQRSMYEQRSMQ